MSIFKYISYKNDTIITQGEMFTTFMSLLIYSTFDEYDIDKVIITFNNGKIFVIDSENFLFNTKPEDISIEEHERWFYKDNPYVNC